MAAIEAQGGVAKTNAAVARAKILGQRIVTPQDFEADNPNLVGGDQVCGSHHLSQHFLFRPMSGHADGSTPLRNLALPLPSFAQAITELVIAYNVNLSSWDLTTGPSAIKLTIQGLYQSVFEQYIPQQPDLKPTPGLLTEWGRNDDKSKITLKIREGVTWHDGSPFTAEVKQFDPTIFKWMYFLTGYVLPKAYYTKVGAVGF